MAAPTASPDLSIQERLENLLTDGPEPTEKPKEVQPTNEEEPEIKDPGDDPPPDPVEEGEEEPPEVKLETEDPEHAEVGDDEVRTMSDLAKMFEIDEATLLDHLEVDAGGGKTVKLGEVITTFKNAPEAVRRWDELSNQQAAFTAEVATMRERTDSEVRNLAATAQALLDITTEEFKDIKWKELELEEPQQYLILKNKQAERGAAISGAIEKLRAVEQGRLADISANTAKTRQSEMTALARKMPEWAEADTANAAMRDTHDFLLSSDFSADEINAIADHRQLIVAWKAAQWDKLKKNAPKKLAKLRGLPKPKNVLRSGARRDSSGDAKKKSQSNLDRLRQTGDARDAARLLEEHL